MSNQSRVIDSRRIAKRTMTHGIADDLLDLIAPIALFGQCGRHGLVYDLKVSTACELFEFHQGEIWLDAGRITIHNQTNCAGWGNHSGLRIAIAMFLAQGDGGIPAFF